MSSNLVRRGGLTGLMAGTMYALTAISVFAPQEGLFYSFSDYAIEAVFVVALAGTLVAIVGLHALQRGRYGRLGVEGSLTAFVGFALLSIVASATALAGRETLGADFPLGVLAVLGGSVLLGAATLRARVLPWWCGGVFIGGFPLSVATDVAVSGAGGIVLAAVWALVGYALLSDRGAVPAVGSARGDVAPGTKSP